MLLWDMGDFKPSHIHGALRFYLSSNLSNCLKFQAVSSTVFGQFRREQTSHLLAFENFTLVDRVRNVAMEKYGDISKTRWKRYNTL